MKPVLDLKDPITILRIAVGLIYIPHVLYKFQAFDGLVAYFTKVGLEPGVFFVVLAILTESAVIISMLSNFLVKWLGLASAGTMLVAVYTTLFTKGAFVWTWNKGGIEYICVLGLVSAVVAYDAWIKEKKAYGRNFFLWPTGPKVGE